MTLAAELVARDGPGALTMERLAECAEVTKPVVYRHFANRSALVQAVVDSAWKRLDAAVAEAVSSEPEGPARIRAAFSASIAHTAQESRGVRILLDNAGGEAAIDRLHEARAAVQRAEWEQRFVSDFSLPLGTARAAASVLQGALSGAIQHASRSPRGTEEAQEVFVTAMTATLGALAAQAKPTRRRKKSRP